MLNCCKSLHACFSAGWLHGGSSQTLKGQQSFSWPKGLHIAGLHAWISRSPAFSVTSACGCLNADPHAHHRVCGCVPGAGQVNSRTMLLPLLQRFTSQMRVSLYHTPDLRGLLRLLVPERFNETIGVQHIKVYLFDNSIIISGYVGFSRVLVGLNICSLGFGICDAFKIEIIVESSFKNSSGVELFSSPSCDSSCPLKMWMLNSSPTADWYRAMMQWCHWCTRAAAEWSTV